MLNRRLAGEAADPAAASGAPSALGARITGAFRLGDRVGVWTNMRMGPRYGESFPGSAFPARAIGELSKQGIPDLTAQVPAPNPTFRALSTLAGEVGGAVLVSHSQSGGFPMEAALTDPAGIRGIVAVEPGACRPTFTDEEIARLAKVPMLILFGDYLTARTGLPGPTWQDRYEGCTAFAARIRTAHGRIDVVRLADIGLLGNSHMVMQDLNNIKVADYMLRWIDRLPALRPS